jgi:hypothetical protein
LPLWIFAVGLDVPMNVFGVPLDEVAKLGGEIATGLEAGRTRRLAWEDGHAGDRERADQNGLTCVG